jgi:hypothetical protein
MSSILEPMHDDVSMVARKIVDTPESELSELIHRLRWHRQLTSTVHALNGLAQSPPHVELGRQALRRLGLERCG